MRHGKLDCLDFEVVARKSPGEIRRGDHMLSKPTKGVFVADVEDGLLINVALLFAAWSVCNHIAPMGVSVPLS